MTIPDFQTLLLPVLKVAAGGEISVRDAVQRLADQMALTEEEKGELLPSGRQTTFSNRVHWAKTYLAKAELLSAPRRGVFEITDRGRQVLAQNLPKLDLDYLMQFPEFKRFREGDDDTNDTPSPLPNSKQKLTPDEVMRSAHRQLEDELASDLLGRILAAPPDFFERVVVQLLIAMGYGGSAAEAGRALGKSGDGGVDGVVDEDALGLDRIYVQAKRFSEGSSVGAAAIRDFFGSLDRFKATKGLFVTTSVFTSSATETAELLSKRIVLIDGRQLTKLMIRYGVGCRVEENLSIKKVDEDFFE